MRGVMRLMGVRLTTARPGVLHTPHLREEDKERHAGHGEPDQAYPLARLKQACQPTTQAGRSQPLKKPGEYEFTCQMGMFRGKLIVE